MIGLCPRQSGALQIGKRLFENTMSVFGHTLQTVEKTLLNRY